MKSLDLVKILFSFLVTFLIIDFSPFLLTKIQPDSTDYLNFHPKRQTTYYNSIIRISKDRFDFFSEIIFKYKYYSTFLFNKKKN